jgi:hypothetical protein
LRWRRLTLAGAGNRATARVKRRTDELVAGLVEAVTREPGSTTSRLEVLLRDAGLGVQRGDAGKAARAAEEAGLIVRKDGKRGSFLHFLKGQEPEHSRPIPTIPAGKPGELPRPLPTPPYEGRGGAVLLEGVGAPVLRPGRVDLDRPAGGPTRDPGADDDKAPEAEV